jgi:hypothetical protein
MGRTVTVAAWSGGSRDRDPDTDLAPGAVTA